MTREGPAVQMYGFWRSQATFRVRVALNFKGVDYQEIPVKLDSGEQDADAFRQINPLGAVPALMIDGKALTQSLAILEYLEDVYPDPPLLPRDAFGRARVRSLAAIAVSDTHPLIVPRVRRYLAETAGFDGSRWKAWQSRWFSAGLRGWEARLVGDEATGRFCHGDNPTMADICLAGLHAGAITFGVEVADLPTIAGIVDRCRALEPFVRAEATRQTDYPA